MAISTYETNKRKTFYQSDVKIISINKYGKVLEDHSFRKDLWQTKRGIFVDFLVQNHTAWQVIYLM